MQICTILNGRWQLGRANRVKPSLTMGGKLARKLFLKIHFKNCLLIIGATKNKFRKLIKNHQRDQKTLSIDQASPRMIDLGAKSCLRLCPGITNVTAMPR